MAVIQQATVWSQREHCARAVVKSLLKLDADGHDLRRIWLVNGERSIKSLSGLDNLPTSCHRPNVPVFPQREPQTDRELKKRAICESWEYLLRMVDPAHDVLFVEDDCVVPRHVLKQLRRTAYERNALAVSAVAVNHEGGLPFFVLTDDAPARIYGVPDQPIEVACGGTFCCYFRADAFRILAELGYQPTWEPHDSSHSRGLIGKDCHLFLQLYDAGYPLVIDPAVEARLM